METAKLTALELPLNRWARVEHVEGDEILMTRLMEMGFTPGECIRVVAASPFHDPIAVNLRGAVFALRAREASCLKICLM